MSVQLEMPTSPSKSSKSRFGLATLFLAIVILIIAFAIWLYMGSIHSNDGHIKAVLVPIPSPMSSTLTNLATQEGAFVEAGQTIGYLDVSEYNLQRRQAEALVRGMGVFSAANMSTQVAQTQKAAEDMIKRLALARNEEYVQKMHMEKQSLEHAKALIHKRNSDIQGSAHAKQQAHKDELAAAHKLKQAAAAFELASLSRAAVEKAIQQFRSQTSAQNAANLGTVTDNPGNIVAPVSGYIVGPIPKEQDIIVKGQTLFNILPEPAQGYYAKATVSPEDGQKLAISMTCFAMPKHSINLWQGTIVGMSKELNATHVHIRLEKTFLSSTITSSDIPAQIVFWPQKVFSLLPKSVQPVVGMLSIL